MALCIAFASQPCFECITLHAGLTLFYTARTTTLEEDQVWQSLSAGGIIANARPSCMLPVS